MVEKNKKKEDAKKYRNLWQLNPVTRVVKNKKGYDRARDRKYKDLYEYDKESVGESY